MSEKEAFAYALSAITLLDPLVAMLSRCMNLVVVVSTLHLHMYVVCPRCKTDAL